MRFEILGRLTVTGDDGREVALPAGAPRAVLAALLLKPNLCVTVDQLAEAVWGDEPPRTVAQSLRNHVLRLRRGLGPEISERVRTVAAGYLVDVRPGELDVLDFTQGCERGWAALRADDAETAGRHLAAALALWRGEPLVDVTLAGRLGAHLERLRETRMLAVEGRIEADLRRGLSAELVSELRLLVFEHPLREALHGQLMLALYRAGRQAEALEVFQRLRADLVGELGVEPSAAVQALHRQVLAGDARLTAGPAAAPAPVAGVARPAQAAIGAGPTRPSRRPVHQLPGATRVFTGRREELDRLLSLADEVESGNDAGMVVISAINGLGGVGKSALAVHAAHQLRARFPDGELFLDLHGHTRGIEPMPVAEALDRLLRSLGVPPRAIPENLEERAACYRDRLAGSRTLVVLDNAAGSAQVRPLLPGAPGSLVIVTSRRMLTGLDDADTITVGTLPESDAVALLRKIAGPGRIPEDHPELAELAALCGWLPLALRITGSRLRHHRTLDVHEVVTQLRDGRRRLSYLRDEDRELASVFESSYADLPPAERRLFRRLGRVPGAHFDAFGAAALAGVDVRTAERLLESLLGQSLLEEHSPGRYRFHDLVRLFAHELAGRDEEDALPGLLDYYQHTAQRADALLTEYVRPAQPPSAPAPDAAPNLADQAEARAWMRQEAENLLASIHHATIEAPDPVRTLALTAALATFLQQEGRWQTARELHQVAAEAAADRGDRHGAATARWQSGRILFLSGELAAAHAVFAEVAGEFAELGDRLGEAVALTDLSRLAQVSGDDGGGAAARTEALRLFEELGDLHGTATVLREISHALVRSGDHLGAAELQERLVETYRQLGSRTELATAQVALGRCRRIAGNPATAVPMIEQALVEYQELGSRLGGAFAQWELGRACHDAGELARAATAHEEALRVFAELGHRHGEANARHQLGRVRHALGDHAAATELLARSLELARELNDAETESEILNSQGRLAAATGGVRAALTLHEEALRIARGRGLRLQEAESLACLQELRRLQ